MLYVWLGMNFDHPNLQDKQGLSAAGDGHAYTCHDPLEVALAR